MLGDKFYFVINERTFEDYYEDEEKEIVIDDEIRKYYEGNVAICLPNDFECIVSIKCNLNTLSIVDSDSVIINIDDNVSIQEFQYHYSVYTEQKYISLFYSMNELLNLYQDSVISKLRYPAIVQDRVYDSEDELLEDRNRDYYIYTNVRRFFTNVYDKETNELICQF